MPTIAGGFDLGHRQFLVHLLCTSYHSCIIYIVDKHYLLYLLNGGDNDQETRQVFIVLVALSWSCLHV